MEVTGDSQTADAVGADLLATYEKSPSSCTCGEAVDGVNSCTCCFKSKEPVENAEMEQEVVDTIDEENIGTIETATRMLSDVS